jgi:hypothetical protein
MVRLYMANISNDVSAAFNDTTLFDKVWKTKGFVEQGMTNSDIALMMADGTTSSAEEIKGGASVATISCMVQVQQ